VHTVVQVGTDYREVREALAELAETRKTLREGGSATDKDWTDLEAQKKSLEASASEILESFALKGSEGRGSVKVALRAYPGVEVIIGDGYRGLPEHAPFDGIIVTAAPEAIPQPLLDQLAMGARLVIPVGGDFQELMVVERTEKGMESREIFPVRFVPMTGEAQRKP
jgi:hypothetical protein